MKTLPQLTALITASLLSACATAPRSPAAQFAGTVTRGPAFVSDITRVAHSIEVPIEKNNPPAEDGHPLTSVVVTQCNLIVAVYVTMPDGRLLRFDHSAGVPPEQLLGMAYSATRSERVEVACEDNGVVGYETHAPV